MAGVIGRVRHAVRMAINPFSIGVRAMVEDDAGAILLVRHTYVAGWHFPGGGIDAHETAVEAVAREMREEAGLEPDAPPQLLGVFFNRRLNGRDHVLFFRCPRWRRVREFRPNIEIAEARFFARGELPGDLSAGTRRRIAEIAGAATPSHDW